MYFLFRPLHVWAILLQVLFQCSLAAAQSAPMPASTVFTVAATRQEGGALSLAIGIQPGNYLYRDSLSASVEGRQLAMELPPGQEKDDPNFGRVEIYYDNLLAHIQNAPASGKLGLGLQGCSEAGICYPQVVKTLDLATLAVSEPAKVPAARPDAFAPLDLSAGPVPTSSDASSTMSSSPLVMMIGFLGFGLLLSFTPCVFPMIPVLAAMLGGAGEGISARRGFMLSFVYVLAMAAAYGLVGFLAGWSGANLQAILQTPAVLGISAVLFAGLGLSMFGLFELRLPQSLSQKLPSPRGTLGGAALLGFGSALVVGPCVTPPLAAAMLYAVQTGEAVRGGAALFALGLGMGLPLIVVGTAGAKILPKSGRWLARIRQGFAVVFLAIAVMLATRLMAGTAALAVWGAFVIGVAVFLGAFDRLETGSAWNVRLGKTGGLLCALYGVLMIVGAAGGNADPLRPLAFLSAPPGDAAEAGEIRVTSLAALERAVADSPGPVLVSFTADWCTTCKSNEKVMRRPDIQALLKEIAVVKADVTNQAEDQRTMMSRFSVVGPPVLFLMNAEGLEIPGTRIVGPITAGDITARFKAAGA